MADEEPIDVQEVAEQVLPYDGPHPPQAIVAAADVIGQLVRRLNNATQSPAKLPYPGHVYRLTGELHYALELLPQLLRQMARRMEAFAGDSHVVSSMADRDPAAESTAAASALRRVADGLRGSLTALADAHRHLGPLGYADDGTDG